MMAEWSKTLVLQIQVAKGLLGPRFEFRSGLQYNFFLLLLPAMVDLYL